MQAEGLTKPIPIIVIYLHFDALAWWKGVDGTALGPDAGFLNWTLRCCNPAEIRHGLEARAKSQICTLDQL